MRTFTRLAVVAILVVSCADQITGPTVDDCAYAASTDTATVLAPDSLHLVLGSADYARLERLTYYCNTPSYQPVSQAVDWSVRDSSVAEVARVNPGTTTIVPKEPGRTFLIAEVAGFVDSIAVSVPDTAVMGSVISVAAGGSTSCAVSDQDQAWCWGSSQEFQLGEPGADASIGTCWGVPCSPVPVRLQTEARSVYLGPSHACSLDALGTARCWGENSWGQLGVSPSEPVVGPVEVGGGLAFTGLALGQDYTCGLGSTGAAYCWGNAAYGVLGGGSQSPSSTPAAVSGDLRFTSLTTGAGQTCGATTQGSLYCWGLLGSGAPPGAEICQVVGAKGDSPQDVPCSYVPLRMPLTALPNDSTFVQVSGRCALTLAGSIYCQDSAHAGYHTLPGFDEPGPLVAIAGSGSERNCGLTGGGTAWCWGSSARGDGRSNGDLLPVAVAGGHVFTQLSVSSSHTCGLTAQNDVWCWGENGQGQAGTSILDTPVALVPVRVRGQL